MRKAKTYRVYLHARRRRAWEYSEYLYGRRYDLRYTREEARSLTAEWRAFAPSTRAYCRRVA